MEHFPHRFVPPEFSFLARPRTQKLRPARENRAEFAVFSNPPFPEDDALQRPRKRNSDAWLIRHQPRGIVRQASIAPSSIQRSTVSGEHSAIRAAVLTEISAPRSTISRRISIAPSPCGKLFPRSALAVFPSRRPRSAAPQLRDCSSRSRPANSVSQCRGETSSRRTAAGDGSSGSRNRRHLRLLRGKHGKNFFWLGAAVFRNISDLPPMPTQAFIGLLPLQGTVVVGRDVNHYV